MEEKMNEKSLKVELGINKIKVIETALNDDAQFETENLNISYNFGVDFNIADDLISVKVNIFYWVGNHENKLANILVNNIFILKDLKNYKQAENQLDIPDSVISTFLGISISHTRALMSQHLAGSRLENYLFPIIPMKVLMKQFKEAFSEGGEE
jgi:hypothetical protein